MSKDDVYKLPIEPPAFKAPKKPKTKPVEPVTEGRSTDTWVIQCPNEKRWQRLKPDDLNTVGCDKPFDPLGFKREAKDES